MKTIQASSDKIYLFIIVFHLYRCLFKTNLLPTEPNIIFNNESSNECLNHQRLHDKFSIFAANPQSYLTSDLTAPDLILIIEFLIREVLGPRLVATVFIEEVGCNQLAID